MLMNEFIHFLYCYICRKSFQSRFWQGSNNEGLSQVTQHKTNGDTTLPKPLDQTCSLQNSANKTFLKGDSSRLFDLQMSETSHETQDVVTNPNNCTCRSKSSKKSLVCDISFYNFVLPLRFFAWFSHHKWIIKVWLFCRKART